MYERVTRYWRKMKTGVLFLSIRVLTVPVHGYVLTYKVSLR